MDEITLRILVRSVVLLVFAYHIIGATRTFALVKGERPGAGLQLLPLSYVVLIYKTFNTPIRPSLAFPGLLAFAGSLALFEWARRSIRGKFFSYAYSNDTPQFLWTEGPYAYIRNPFYASYLLSYAGAMVLFPGLTTLIVFAVMGLFFLRIALHEERKFLRSELSEQYAAYKQRTGRFIPKLW